MTLLALCVAAMLLEFTFMDSGPFVAMYVCAGVVGWTLPKRSFLVILFLLAAAVAVPLLVTPVDAGQLLPRGIAWFCLGLLAVLRMFHSPEPNEATFDVGEDSETDDGFKRTGVETVDVDDFGQDDASFVTQSPPTSDSGPSTEVPATHHRASREPGQFQLDAGTAANFIEPALKRLHSSGQFDKTQMAMIAKEMRDLEDRGMIADFAQCLEAGTQIGRFVLEEPLGRGGEGNVYRAHNETGDLAAVKILHNMRVSARFRREMHMVRKLAHPNIVTAYEVGEFRGLPFITMEFLRGPDLYALVKQSGPLAWLSSSWYILQASRALAHAHHRDLIHRDVKPGNMILHGEQTIKLIDLGLAAMSNEETGDDSVFRLTLDGHLAGTLPYMAPEQARSLANATVKSDIYGLGASWFYLLTGKERLRGKNYAEQFENLLVRRRFHALPSDIMPAELVKIYRRMVAYKVEKRYDSCDQLAADLEQALSTAGESVLEEGINVLVVEDSRTDMIFTLEMLRRSNSTLSVHQARSLTSGIEVCRDMPIDLVLLDLTLPDSSGVETVTRFREQVDAVPLVVLTGLTKDEVGADCLAAGADTFISKHGLTAHRMERSIFVTLSRRATRRTKAESGQKSTVEESG